VSVSAHELEQLQRRRDEHDLGQRSLADGADLSDEECRRGLDALRPVGDLGQRADGTSRDRALLPAVEDKLGLEAHVGREARKRWKQVELLGVGPLGDRLATARQPAHQALDRLLCADHSRGDRPRRGGRLAVGGPELEQPEARVDMAAATELQLGLSQQRCPHAAFHSSPCSSSSSAPARSPSAVSISTASPAPNSSS